MLNEQEYLAQDATGLAELVRRREATPEELLNLAIARAERTNPRLNAIVIRFDELARARARAPLSGPFAGVPFLLKDLHQEYEGVCSSWGSLARKRWNQPAAQHDVLVERWLAAGLVPFGYTNTPEFGAKGVTEPDAWGPTTNPWKAGRTPGGSSGGSAAAVAAGIVPAAGGSDGGGSIRIPAAYTGLFGLKPGRGRVPTGPARTEELHGAIMQHVLTRSVRDSARLLDATHGAEPGSWTLLAPPSRPYAESAERDPSPLRIAFSTRSPIGRRVDAEAVRAVEDAARLLESLGHHVEPAEPVIDGAQLVRDWLCAWYAHVASEVADTQQLTGAGRHGFESDTMTMAALGRALSAPAYLEAHGRWSGYLRELSRLHERYALYMTPAVAGPAPAIGSTATHPILRSISAGLVEARLDRLIALGRAQVLDVAYENLRHVPFTQLANLTGVPAMSVPLHITADGLPLGVQFLAPHGGEELLFSLAGQLERASPWAARYPFARAAGP